MSSDKIHALRLLTRLPVQKVTLESKLCNFPRRSGGTSSRYDEEEITNLRTRLGHHILLSGLVHLHLGAGFETSQEMLEEVSRYVALAWEGPHKVILMFARGFGHTGHGCPGGKLC